MIVVTQSDGLVVVYVRDPETNELRQRAAVDLGRDETHLALAKLGDSLVELFSLNGRTKTKRPAAIGPAVVETAPVDPNLERKRAYNRAYYRRTRAKMATASDRPLTGAERTKLYGHASAGPRASRAEMAERRRRVVETLRERPGLTVSELSTLFGQRQSYTKTDVDLLRRDGVVTRSGTGTSDDPHRYFVVEETTTETTT